MSSIDNRIVEMQFNNQQFERGISTSIRSLDNLKRGLDLEGATKGLSNLDRVGRSFSLDSITSGVDYIKSKFTTLGLVGVTAIQNITNSVIDAGKRMVDSLVFDPIFTGFEEYETKMGAIQTILTNTASKGTTLDDVNKALNELNHYADQTIYNFAEMARNIGTFTAAGVDLNTSVTSIKGIANLAAGSGSSAQQAATAMYQLSQAIASGSVKLMDWNSVVNAGMGGELFQKALEKTALELGHGRDMSVSFRESLEKGWITTEVLTKTLQKFANDESLVKAATQVKTFTQLFTTMKESVQSGWAQTWETIIGNKDESTALFTAISDAFGSVIGASGEARNAMLEFWKANGGRTALIQAISNVLITLADVIQPIEEAFREIFPALTGERLVALTKSFKDLTDKFKMGEDTINNIKRTFKGLFALLDIVRQALVAVGKGVFEFVKLFLPAGEGLLSFTGNIGDLLVALNEFIKTSNIFNIAIGKLVNILKPIADFIKKIAATIFDAFEVFRNADVDALSAFVDRVKERFKSIAKIGEFLSSVFTTLVTLFSKLIPIFEAVGRVIGFVFDKIKTSLQSAVEKADFSTMLDLVNGGIFVVLTIAIKKFLGSISSVPNAIAGFIRTMSGSVSKFVNQFTDILDGVKDSLQAYQSNLKANVLLKIAISIGILAASLMALSLIDSKKLTVSLAAVTTMFIQLFGSMAIFEKIMRGRGIIGIGKISLAMLGLSASILVLSFAVTRLSRLDWQEIAKGLTAVTVLMATLIATAKFMPASSARLISTSIGLTVFGAALLVLSSSVTKLAQLDTGSLTRGLIGVGVLVTGLAVFLKAVDLDGMGLLKGLGLLTLATAINILAKTAQTFAALDVKSLIKGLAGITVVLAGLAGFIKITGDSKRVMATALGLVILSTSMLVFSKAIASIGTMPIETLAKGLLTMAGALGIIALAIKVIPPDTLLKSTSIAVMAGALLILSRSLTSMGNMSWEELARGMSAIAGSLSILAVAMKFMSQALPGAFAILIAAGAIAILAPALKMLGSLNIAEIGVALLALVSVFAVLGAATYFLGEFSPVMLAMAGSLTLLGIACMTAGVGVLAVGGGILALSMALATLAGIGAAGVASITLVIYKLSETIPTIAQSLAKGLINFVRTIGENFGTIAQTIKTAILTWMDIIKELTPVIWDRVLGMLDVIMKAILQYLPEIVRTGMKVILSLLEGINSKAYEITKTGIQIIINIMDATASMLPKLVQSGQNLIITYINALADGIRKNTQPMIDAMKNLMDAVGGVVAEMLKQLPGKFTEIGENIILGLVQGMKNQMSKAKVAAANIGSSVLDAAKDALGIRSPSKFFREMGENIVKGLTGGITENKQQAVSASTDMSKAVVKESSNVATTAAKESGEAAKSAFDKSVEWIDERKYYNLLSLQEELAAWERVQARYIQGSEERKKADREVYRVKKELIKSEFDNSLNWIDDRKYYSELDLSEELAAWTRVQNRYIEGTAERKKADKEIYRVKKEILSIDQEYTQKVLDISKDANEKKLKMEEEYLEKTKEINEKLRQDVQDVTDVYRDAVNNRAKSIYDTYGLFDKVDKQEKPVKGYELLDNLRDQVTQIENWRERLDTLASRGVDSGLLKELQDMGPRSLPQIDALMKMSDNDLKMYVYLWRKKHQEAREQSTLELESLRVESLKKINELQTEATEELTTYRKMWVGQMRDLKWDTIRELGDLKTEWVSKIGDIRTETEKEFENLVSAAKNQIKKQDWSMSGYEIVNGIKKGVKNNELLLIGTIADMARTSIQTAKDVLKIQSPSKEFEKIGGFTVEGFVNGITNVASKISKVSGELGNETKQSLSNALSNIMSLFDVDFNLSPTITPVIDMSNVEKGLSSTFNKPISLNTSEVANKVSAVSASKQYAETSAVTNQTDNTRNMEIKITNHYSVRSDTDIRKISNDLRSTLERYNNAKGVAVV